jgi:hypothetical protein
MDAEMEFASRCPAEIPCQFNHKRVENSVQKGTNIQAQREYVLRRQTGGIFWTRADGPPQDSGPRLDSLSPFL